MTFSDFILEKRQHEAWRMYSKGNTDVEPKWDQWEERQKLGEMSMLELIEYLDEFLGEKE